MISPAIFFLTVSFALLFAPTTSGKSWHHEFNPATHRTHHIGPHKSLEFQTFHPESTFEASPLFMLFWFSDIQNRDLVSRGGTLIPQIDDIIVIPVLPVMLWCLFW